MNTLEQQKAEIAKLTADLKAAQELVEQANSQLQEKSSLDEKLTETRKELLAAQASIIEKDKSIESLNAEISNLKTSAASVETKAQQLLATQGHAPLVMTPNSDEANQLSVLEKFNSLSGAAQTEFYRKNKAQILREQQRAKNKK